MKKRGQTMFAPEQVQPDWLPDAAGRWVYIIFTRTLAVLVLGAPFWCLGVPLAVKWEFMLAGLVAGLGFAAIDGWFAGPTRTFANEQGRRCVAVVVFLAVGSALGFGLLSWFTTFSPPPAFIACAIVYLPSIAFLLVSLSTDIKARDIVPADAMGWSWRRVAQNSGVAMLLWQEIFLVGFVGTVMANGWTVGLRMLNVHGNGTGLLIGAGLGAIVGVGLLVRRVWRGLVSVAGTLALIAFGGELGDEFAAGFKGGLGAPLTSTLITILLIAPPSGLTANIDDTRARRSGVWFWLKIPLAAGLAIGGAIIVVAAGFVVTVVPKGSTRLLEASPALATIGLFMGLIAFLKFGGLNSVQHLILRRLLARRGRLPNDLDGFLDHAARLNLLQRVGFGYRFIHALLLDHFAEGRQGGASVPAAEVTRSPR